jgi:hypothetical protein
VYNEIKALTKKKSEWGCNKDEGTVPPESENS